MAEDLPLDVLVKRWLTWDKDPSSHAEIESLATQKAQGEPGDIETATFDLEARLRKRIQFGTAGLRSQMKAGFAFMNCLTVIQTSQGIAEYLKQSLAPGTSASVLIGHDTRHNSAKYARLAANAFRSKGIKVLLFEDYVPTPFVSFGVRHLGTNVGIMVTASHNPARDNGYKVYWSNGAQINTPLDQHLAESILENQEPWEGAWDTSSIFERQPTLISEIRQAYVAQIGIRGKENLKTAANRLSSTAVYTPIHGVGWGTMAEVAFTVNFCSLIPVPDQVMPDPNFPTVAFPNPEEDGALNLAYATADKAGLTMVIANDPDADRFAAAEKVNGTWLRFTGDQLGVLFAEYLIEKATAASSSEAKTNPSKTYAMLNSAVSSSMLKKMIHAAGPSFHFEETLTGFKWIGNRAQQLSEQGYIVLFGYEEALGYMFPQISYDKDGIAVASEFLFALDDWAAEGFAAWSKLQSLYKKYGYHESINTYFTSASPEYTSTFFNAIRNSKEISSTTLGGKFSIIRWRDITNGTATGHWDSTLPQDPSSQMLTFHLQPSSSSSPSTKHNSTNPAAAAEEITFTIRASGTEPKVKLYLECCSRSDAKRATLLATEAFHAVVQNWFRVLGAELKHAAGEVVASSGVRVKVDV